MDRHINLTFVLESDVMDVASNSLGGLASPMEGLLNSLNSGVLGNLDAITAGVLDSPVGLASPMEGLLNSLNSGVLGNLDAITAGVLDSPVGLASPMEGLLNSLNSGVLGNLDAITAGVLDPPVGLASPMEGLLNSLNSGVLGNLDAITAGVLDPPVGLNWQPSRAIPEVVYVYPERRQTVQMSRLPERGPDVRHRHDLLGSFDNQVTSAGLVRYTRALFADGHYSVAVEKAFVYVENLVKQQSGLSDKHGSSLMKTVFSLHNPLIRLNAGVTDSDRDEQLGYMEIFAGVMTGIRNPRAHSHNWIDEPGEALALLVVANHLVRTILMATSSRN